MRRPEGRGDGAEPAGPPRTLVGGVGYSDLRDFSAGPWLVRALARERWPDEVVVEDLSYGPVAVVHRLQDATPPFRRLVVAGAARRGRTPGAVTAYRWDESLPDAEEVQARVAEAVTGVISLDNLLVVAGALGALPPRAYVVEVEPLVEAMGEELSPSVRDGCERAARLVRAIATGPDGPGLPVSALGGFSASNGALRPRPPSAPGSEPAPGRSRAP